MLKIIRRSQIVGLITKENEDNSPFDRVQEVWSDPTGRVAYLACTKGYTRVQQISDIDADTVFVHDCWRDESPAHLRCLYRLAVYSASRKPLGWVEDFLFDWQTGEIAAFVLGGNLAAFFGGRAVLFPQDIEGIQTEGIVLKDGAQTRLQRESEGLKGFLSEKKSQVRRLVKCLSDRLYALVSSDDRPEVVRIKIKIVSEELAISGQYDKNALAEATEFVQQHWASIEYDLNRPKQWAKWAVEKAWQQITSK